MADAPEAAGKALVLVHDAVPGRGESGVGTVVPALAALGFAVTVATVVTGSPVPDPGGFDIVVVLGADVLPFSFPGGEELLPAADGNLRAVHA